MVEFTNFFNKFCDIENYCELGTTSMRLIFMFLDIYYRNVMSVYSYFAKIMC